MTFNPESRPTAVGTELTFDEWLDRNAYYGPASYLRKNRDAQNDKWNIYDGMKVAFNAALLARPEDEPLAVTCPLCGRDVDTDVYGDMLVHLNTDGKQCEASGCNPDFEGWSTRKGKV